MNSKFGTKSTTGTFRTEIERFWNEIHEDKDKRLPNRTDTIKLAFRFLPTNEDLFFSEIILVSERTENPVIESFLQTMEVVKGNMNVSRWFIKGNFDVSQIREEKVCLIMNERKNKVPQISVPEENTEFNIIDKGDLVNLSRHVPVNDNFDCNTDLESLQTFFGREVILLQVENGELAQIIPEAVLDRRLMVISGPVAQGKSTVLKRLHANCSTPAISLTSDEVIKTNEEYNNVSKAPQCITHWNNNTELVLFIDDVNNSTTNDRLYDVIEYLLNNKQYRLVLTARERFIPAITARFKGQSEIVKLHSLSRSDILTLIKSEWESAQLSFPGSSILAERIYEKYHSDFEGMSPLVWKTAADLFKKAISEIPTGQLLDNLSLRVSIAKILEEFLLLLQKSCFDNSLSVKEVENAHIHEALREKHPQLTPTISIKTGTVVDLTSMKSSSFTEYLLDLYCFRVLKGSIRFKPPDLRNTFCDLFLERYVKSKSFKCHLNEMLGQKPIKNTFVFDIRKFNMEQILSLSGGFPNISRLLFKSFLHKQNRNIFLEWYNKPEKLTVNVATTLGSMEFVENTRISAANIFMYISVHLGFYDMLKFALKTSYSKKPTPRHIQIRYQESFATLLHLLMFMSRDNDKVTIKEKKKIIDALEPDLQNARDYYGKIPILEENVSFELVKYIKGKDVSLDTTDYKRRNLLDKNKDNPEFVIQLKHTFSEIYEKLYISFCVRNSEGLEDSLRKLNIQNDTNEYRRAPNFQKFLEKDDFVVAYRFEKLDKEYVKANFEKTAKKLQKEKYVVSKTVVFHALAIGSFRLFQLFVEKFHFTPERWHEVDINNGHGVLYYLLANSIHNSNEVIAEKIRIIDLIKEKSTNVLDSCDKQGRTALLYDQVHYDLIRHMIETGLVNVQAEDSSQNNVLNICLQNILHMTDYLGENAYDFESSHHEQVLYLAKYRMLINQSANDQLNEVVENIRKWTKMTKKELRLAGFGLKEDADTTNSVLQGSLHNQQISMDLHETNVTKN